MKKVFLIGDSIRMGYDHYVAQALEGEAQVFWPDENCRFAAYTFYSLGDWEHRMRLGNVDVVHWNAGLHDAVHLHTKDPVTPPDIYAYYINRVCDRLDDLYPNAKKVFATSTPIQEGQYTEWLWRKNSEVARLNEAALEVLDKRGYIINDLYSLVASKNPADIYADASHYNFAGNKMLACAVLNKICPLMGITYDPNQISEVEETRPDILR